jgi:hydrogenase 3 maturation protease
LNVPDDKPPFERIRLLLQSDRTLAFGLGNIDRADDGAGVLIVRQWKARLKERAFFEPDAAVETVVLEGADDTLVETFLFVDAADFGGEPGEFRLFGPEDSDRVLPALSTHKVPMDLLMGIVASKGKRPVLLGIQPGSLEPFGGVSDKVGETIRILAALTGDESVTG